jgi:hypothetical protein
MSLIVAIEPDRRQASRVSALARRIPHAEFLVTESVERALAALKGRVPDLILTSLLLSPKEDARLRELNPSGAPAPTLVIPVLKGGSGQARERGGLLRRLRGSAAAEDDTGACDPGVFAAQVIEYLKSVQEERDMANAARVDLDEPPRSAAAAFPAQPAHEAGSPAPIELMDPAVDSTPLGLDDPPSLEPFDSIPVPAPHATPDLELVRSADDASALEREPWEDIVLDTEGVPAPIELSSEAIDLATFVAELEAEAARIAATGAPKPALEPHGEPFAPAAPFAADPWVRGAGRDAAIVDALSTAAWPPLEGLEAVDATTPDPVIDEFVAALTDTHAPVQEPELDEQPATGDAEGELWMPLPAAATYAWPRLDSVVAAPTPRVDRVAPVLPQPLPPQPQTAPLPMADVERAAATMVRAVRRPVQDEWGFFDPQQCGFDALMAKLEEITK